MTLNTTINTSSFKSIYFLFFFCCCFEFIVNYDSYIFILTSYYDRSEVSNGMGINKANDSHKYKICY